VNVPHTRRHAPVALMATVVAILVLGPAVLLLGMTRTSGRAGSARPIGNAAATAPPTPSVHESASAAPTVDTGPAGPSSRAAATTSPSAPNGSTPGSTPAQASRTSRSVSATSTQYGIQLYLHEVAGGADNIDAILDYVVGLGANSLAVTFPIYTDGPQPTRVYTSDETPSPERVADVVARARTRGLRVTVRPLIDEANIAVVPGQWRGSIKPVDVDRWFQSYGDVIAPYFATGEDEFVMAAELESLQGESDHWQALERAARAVFPGLISDTFNWNGFATGDLPTLDSYGVDLYTPVDLDDDATVDQLTYALVGAINATPEQVRQALVVHELGIPALSGVYRIPWHWGTEGGPIREDIQANWFTAACRAVQLTGLHGIYFWMLDSNIDPLTAQPADQPPSSFVGRLGETSIRDCFNQPPTPPG
jgi:hypothetical protein